MIKFPSIGQYRNAIQNIKHVSSYVGQDIDGNAIFNNNILYPTLKFKGYVKLHGTNAAWSMDSNNISYQSRERELSLESDNAGFYLWSVNHKLVIQSLFDEVITYVLPNRQQILPPITIFGEWCGKGIQKAVGVSELDKMFVIFAVKVEEEYVELDNFPNLKSNEHHIYNIADFQNYEIDINFNHPEIVQNILSDITLKVEEECPVAKHFGISGVGEGVVWHCVSEGWNNPSTWFKVKGEKHSSSKVKTLASVDIETIESINMFVEQVVTENRLKQSIDKLKEAGLTIEMKNMGDFIRWVYNDILREEADTIIANQFDVKKLGSPIANKCRIWFANNLNGV